MEGQFRSHEPSASACAQRCASVVGCAHFSFWTDGGCHLQVPFVGGEIPGWLAGSLRGVIPGIDFAGLMTWGILWDDLLRRLCR